MKDLLFALAWSLLMTTPSIAAEALTDFVAFSGDPVLSWNADGRTMKLVEDLTYFDNQKGEWVALAGTEVDGASIPRIFWTQIGGPFEGKYRNASVVHDTECKKPYRHDWRDVHRMFYNASRAGGVNVLKAKIMFGAVYHFGPRWQWNNKMPSLLSLRSHDDFFRMRALIRRNERMSLRAIEALDHNTLIREVSDLELSKERACGAKLDVETTLLLDGQMAKGEFISGRDSRIANNDFYYDYSRCYGEP